MGPRFCKRGNLALPAVQRSRVEASMGPRFCKRGNTIVGVMTARAKAGLQWGHAFVSVETHLLAGRATYGLKASMGPRFCKRGNLPLSLKCPAALPLQWGHAFVSVETG